jgi:hypothetical protein
MTEEEIISMMQSTLGCLRADLVVVAVAMKGNDMSPERLLVAAELIQKTQDDLSVRADNLRKMREIRAAVPPLPVPGPGRQS